MGHPHSEALRTLERFRRRDFGHLDYEITFDDPKMYTRPFKVRIPHELLADADVFENYCENDPLSVLFRSAFCLVLVCANRGDRAVVEAGKALEIDESLWMTHFGASLGYVSLGKFTEARDSAERAIRLAPWQAFLPGMLAGITACCGEPQQALELLAMRKDTSAAGLAVYHFLLGNIDAALDHYSDAIEQREPFAALFAAAVFLKPLRENSRWPALARMMKLPKPS